VGQVRGTAGASGRLLDTLERLGTPATVMVSGLLTELAPMRVRAVVAGGHEICGHGWVQEQLPAQLRRRPKPR